MDCSTSAADPASSTSALQPPPSCNGRIAWPSGPAKRQYFSLPDNIIYYMARNPKSPELYLQLAKSCKYFFEMLPLLIAKRTIVDENGKRMCAHNAEDCNYKNVKCCVKMDLAKLSSKIWLTGHLHYASSNDSNLVSILLPKLYDCDINIMLWNRKMTMEEFKLWGRAFTKPAIYKGKITDADGTPVTLDSVLEAIPNVKQFWYWLDDNNTAAITPSTMKNVLKLKKFDKLEYFCLITPPEILAVKDLSAFIKAYKDTKILLSFLIGDNMPDEYERQLDELIDDIIASEIPNRVIRYQEQDEEKLQIMESRFRFFD